MKAILKEIRDALVALEAEKVIDLVRRALEEGVDALEILDALTAGMEEVGKKFESGEYFVAELLLAAETFRECVDNYLKPKLQEKVSRVGKKVTVVIGTIKGDIHELGKNLVATMLQAAGFEVIDLGVDVPPEKFVEEAKKRGAKIIAISALLSSVVAEIGNVIKLLEKEGLRNKVKVIIGGVATSEELARRLGADAWGRDAVDAVEKCRKLVSEAT